MFAPLILTGCEIDLIKTVITTLFFSPSAATYTKDFFCGLGITLISWFTSLVTVLILAVFISLIGQSLSWYNHFYVSVCLYGTAAVAKIIFIHTLAKRFYYVVSVGLFHWFLSATFKDWRQTQVGFLMFGLLWHQKLFGMVMENWLPEPCWLSGKLLIRRVADFK